MLILSQPSTVETESEEYRSHNNTESDIEVQEKGEVVIEDVRTVRVKYRHILIKNGMCGWRFEWCSNLHSSVSVFFFFFLGCWAVHSSWSLLSCWLMCHIDRCIVSVSLYVFVYSIKLYPLALKLLCPPVDGSNDTRLNNWAETKWEEMEHLKLLMGRISLMQPLLPTNFAFVISSLEIAVGLPWNVNVFHSLTQLEW